MNTITTITDLGRAEDQIVSAQLRDTHPNAATIEYLTQGAPTLAQPARRVVQLRWEIGTHGLRMQWSEHEG